MSPRKEKFIYCFLGLCFVLMMAANAKGDEGDVRGCIATYLPRTGQYVYEPFLKIAAKESFSEDGRAEVWGFRLWNLEPTDKAGNTRPVNVLEDNFIELGVLKQVGPRKVKCPPYWQRDSGVHAEH